MFQPGDLVVYGAAGVCRVEEITRPQLRGTDRNQKYYLLKPLRQEGVIYAPVDSEHVPIRPVISAREAEELIDLLPSIQAEAFQGTTLQSVAQHYQVVMRSHDRLKLIELMKSIYTKQQQAEAQNRRLGLVDEQYMKQAERLLYGELSAALGIPFEAVESYIARRVDGGVPPGTAHSQGS